MSATTARERVKGTSNLCIRRLHGQCTIPETCLCVCHDALERPAGSSTDAAVWEDPPPARRGAKAGPPMSADLMGELRANPKRWARVRVFAAKSTAAGWVGRYRKGTVPGLVAGEWELAARSVDGGRSALYARFLDP